MSGEAWLFLFAVIINAVNLFLQVFFTIMYSDLEWYGIPDKKKRAGLDYGQRSGWQLLPACSLAPSAAACALPC
jgi:hypothetical protein